MCVLIVQAELLRDGSGGGLALRERAKVTSLSSACNVSCHPIQVGLKAEHLLSMRAAIF